MYRMVEHTFHSLTVTRVRDSSSCEAHSEETITQASNPSSHTMEPAAGLVCKMGDQELWAQLKLCSWKSPDIWNASIWEKKLPYIYLSTHTSCRFSRTVFFFFRVYYFFLYNFQVVCLQAFRKHFKVPCTEENMGDKSINENASLLSQLSRFP